MSVPQMRLISLLLISLLSLGGCASNGKDANPGSLRDNPLEGGTVDNRRVKRLTVEQLYAAARAALDSSDYLTALELYNRLEASFPFTPQATQGRLEAIYAHYRNYEPELALASSDRFLRANPRHEHIDYVYYLRGLVNFERGNTDILDFLDINSTGRDPINERRAFEDFGRLVKRFPESPYAADARQRMVYLRNRIAQHEFGIAQYYEKRRAWVAASRRAEELIAKFQGSAIIPETLDLLARCYDELKLPERAEQIRAVRQASYPAASAEAESSEEQAFLRDTKPPQS